MAHNNTIKALGASILLLIFGLTAIPVQDLAAATAKSNKNERYVVKKGDTLWDIASRFLHDPWRWPEVWHVNPKIRNPHLIFPGDVVLLYFVDGKPRLTLEGSKVPHLPVTKDGMKVVKLSPKGRIEPLSRAITTVPRDIIEPFLRHTTVLDDSTFDDLPHIISSYEEHLISGRGNKIYVRNLPESSIGTYTVVRQGTAYRLPGSYEVLGYEALHLAQARVVEHNRSITTLEVGESWQEVLNGDRLLPYEETRSDFFFFPRAPRQEIHGRIISVLGGVSMIGQYAVVVLNKGEGDGIIPGHVMAIFQDGARVRDSLDNQPVRLPNERAGLLMVFKVFNKVSFALVLETQRVLSVNDVVTNP